MDLFKTKQGEEIERLQQENDELRALLDDYKDFTGLVDFDGKVVTKTISKIKADAIREMLNEVWRSDTERVDIEDYATNLEQDNE